jgi:HSP20 family protein
MTELKYHRFSPEQSSSKKPKFVLSSSYEKWSARLHIWQPPTDLYESVEEFIIQVEIAGMREAEFAISLEQRTLMIRGIRNVQNNARAYYQMEITTGEFFTAVELPGPVIHDQIEAHYSDGFLKIVLPKAKPSSVDIESNENH